MAAIEKENVDIVKLLLTNDNLDVNVINISQLFFNKIQNYIFQCNSKSYISMKLKTYILIPFKIIYFNHIQNHVFKLHSKSYN